jgi:hypothetical protein
MQTQLLGQPVRHISFGRGIITDVSNKIITIRFSQGVKKFLYPDAFSGFLTLKDAEKQVEINAKYNRRLRDEETERKKYCERKERSRQLRTMKIAPNSQAAFHVDGRAAKKIIESGSVSTGCYLSGYSKGEPRIPNRLKPNSACLLTALPEGEPEEKRRILGVFMVNEDFWGDQCRNGIIDGHSRHRVVLPEKLCLSYWEYIDHGAALPCWGKIKFKYIPNTAMQKILFAICQSFAGTQQEPDAKAFYQYFCELNRLSAFPLKETEQA